MCGTDGPTGLSPELQKWHLPHDEHIQDSEGCSRNGEEIDGTCVVHVIPEESPPRLRWRSSGSESLDDLRDCPFMNLDTP